MNGNSVVLDTNVVLYLLNGDKKLAELLYNRKLYLSFITQIELLGFKGITTQQKKRIENFIEDCIVIDINEDIKKQVIELRKSTSLKIPDCFVLATSVYLKTPLITSDKALSLPSFEIIIYEL
jgi:predicted nucleic acid-binding protein